MVAKKSSRFPVRRPRIYVFVFSVIFIFACAGIGFFIHSTSSDYIVETNAFFAPFEFYEGAKIKGVDVEIMQRVADNMNKKIKIVNVDFAVIIDNVEQGRVADAGAAGITITPARAEKVNFSLPYYTSSQYLIYQPQNPPFIQNHYVLFSSLANKKIGTQIDTTGFIFTSNEIDDGVLTNTGATLKGFESAQLAADGILAGLVDFVVIDELPAKYIVNKNPRLTCLPLFYSGEPDYPVQESYAIAVNKNRPELLRAINDTLSKMLEKDANGESEIERLVIKYMGV